MRAPARDDVISFAESAADPPPGLAYPQSITFSPDDQAVLYLRSADHGLARQLHRFDLVSGEEMVLVGPPANGATEERSSLAGQLRRERARVHARGVTSYAWAERGHRLWILMGGSIHVQDHEGAPFRLLVTATDSEPVLDPQMSPDGDKIAYVQDGELVVISVDDGRPQWRTTGARGTGKTHGLAEYIAQEEMGRDHGFWWSRDGRLLAFTEVDGTEVSRHRIIHHGDGTGEGAEETHEYPFAGGVNAKVRLGVVAVGSDRVIWMDLGDDPEQYLARVQWLPDGDLTAQVENRAQTCLTLLRLDPRTGCATTILKELSDTWINLHEMLCPIAEGAFAGHVVWASERSGFRHLYLYDGCDSLVRPLTAGEAHVDAVVTIDEACGLLYYLGNTLGAHGDPTGRGLYVVPLVGGAPRCLTPEAGTHDITIDHGLRRFIDAHSNISSPPRLRLRDLETGAVIADIAYDSDPRLAALRLRRPGLTQFTNRHGDTLHAAVYRPDGDGRFPTLVSVYGGPQVQRVVDTWALTVDMHAQALCSRGYLVVKIDNRGSARRGVAFEAAIYRDLGHLEIEDQQDGVAWLISRGLADPARVGIYGWSYGGYLAAMALARAPNMFKLAIAAAPVTHWDGYDTHYTERYMGLPAEHPDAYAVSSVIHHVAGIRGKLLLVHGLLDENVHFRHTGRLIRALIAACKPYDLMLLPDERHAPRCPTTRVYLEEQMIDYIGRYL